MYSVLVYLIISIYLRFAILTSLFYFQIKTTSNFYESILRLQFTNEFQVCSG